MVSLIGVTEVTPDFNKSIKRYFKLIYELAFRQNTQNGGTKPTSPTSADIGLRDESWNKLANVLGKHFNGECLNLEQLLAECPSISAELTPVLYQCLSHSSKCCNRGAIEALIRTVTRGSALEQEINKIE